MSDRELRVVVPEPRYTLFDATREGLPEVVVVNESLLSFLEIEAFPWHLRVTIGAEELVENGMPSPSESALLFGIGDEIETTVLNGTTTLGAPNALFLGRSTWNSRRELEFQVHDPEVAHKALQELLVSRAWERGWEYKMKGDASWQEAGRLFELFSLSSSDA